MSKINNKLILFGLGILTILAFGLIAFVPTETKAYNENLYYRFQSNPEPSNPTPTISSIKPNSIDEFKEKVTITITGNGFIPSSVVRKNNSNRTTTFIDSKHLLVDIYPNDVYKQSEFFLTVWNSEPGGGYSNALLFTIKNNATVTTTNKTNNYSSTTYKTYNDTNSNNYNNTDTTVSKTTETNNNVAASDINESYGSLTANALLGSNSFMPTGLVQWIFLAIIIVAIIFLWRYVHRSEEKYMTEPMKHA